MSDRVIRAQYKGWCSVCRCEYKARTDIKRNPITGKWVHADASECVPQAAAPKSATPVTRAGQERRYDSLTNEGGEGYNPYRRERLDFARVIEPSEG